MKLFLWLITLTLSFLAWSCWVLLGLALRVHAQAHAGDVLPAFTQLIAQLSNAWFLVPLVWTVYAGVLSARKEVTPGMGLVFLGTALLAGSLVFFVAGVAGLLPWMDFAVKIGSHGN